MAISSSAFFVQCPNGFHRTHHRMLAAALEAAQVAADENDYAHWVYQRTAVLKPTARATVAERTTACDNAMLLDDYTSQLLNRQKNSTPNGVGAKNES